MQVPTVGTARRRGRGRRRLLKRYAYGQKGYTAGVQNQPTDVDLREMARREAEAAGFTVEPGPEVAREVEALDGARATAAEGVEDLRGLLWSSIDNPDSRDLDQVEYAERLSGGGLRLLVGVADVDAYVPRGSAVDRYAYNNTVSVYTPAVVFHMLPARLSTDLTSLLEGVDRLAVVVELTVEADGRVARAGVRRALVRNRRRLTYERVGAWLDGREGLPSEVAEVEGLEEQLRLQAEASERLRALRRKAGSLELETVEADFVVSDGRATDLVVKRRTRAEEIIESFMVAANTAMAEYLEARGVASLRRVVHKPFRWGRLVDLARRHGGRLPRRPDARALADFLTRQRAADPGAYVDLSLSVVKLLGSGEYLVEYPGREQEGHFGLAVEDYTHSTAPNRRYPDLVTQRCLKATAAGAPAPYTAAELEEIARRCNLMEDRARTVERRLRKAATASLLGGRVGQLFDAVVTGVNEKGTFVRVCDPPAEGRVTEGEQGLDVGDRVRVRLISTDPARGFIDFAAGKE